MARSFFEKQRDKMTLMELVYRIDGSLESKSNPDHTCTVELLDDSHEQARVSFVSDNGYHRETIANATGTTRTEAENNLVKLLRGNVLTTSLRIPPTLTAR